MDIKSTDKNTDIPKLTVQHKTPGLLISVFSLIILTLIVLGYVNFRKAKEKQYVNAGENLELITENKTDRIIKWRYDIIVDARKLMNDIIIQKFLADWFNSGMKKNETEFIKKWLRNYLDSAQVSEFVLFSQDKKSLVFSDKPEKLAETERKNACDRCMQSKDVVMSDLYIEKEHNSVRISVFIPVIFPGSDSRKVSGTIMFEINPYAELYPIIETWPVKSNSSRSVIVCKDSESVLFLSNLISEGNSALKLKLPLSDTNFVSVKAVNGRSGIYEGRDYNNREVIATSRTISNTNWVLLSCIDKEELDYQVRKTTNLIFGFIILIILFFILLFALVIRHNRLMQFSEQLKIEKQKNIHFERLNTILQYANDSILLLDGNGNILDANDKAIEIYGYTKDEFTGLNIRDLRTRPEKASFDDALITLKKHRSLVIETTHITKSGRVIPVEASVSLITFEGEDYIQNIVRDISDRKESEKRLMESEHMFKSVFDYANDAMFILERGRIIDANKNAEILFGMAKENLIGKRPFEISPPYQEGGRLSREKAIEVIERAESGKPQFFEWTHRNSDGVDFNTEVSLNTILLNDKNLIFAVIRDITFRKYAENTLRERENRLNLVLEGAEIGYYDMNLITGEVITNERCYKMLGYDDFDVIYDMKWWRDLVHPDDVEMSEYMWQEYISGNKGVYEVEVRLKKKDGSWLWILDKCKLFEFTVEGKPLRAVGTHLDISALKETEEAMRKAKNAAEEASRLKSNFLANMSHELRTPMTGILGFSEILFSELNDPDHKEMAELIFKGGKRLMLTLNSILDLSRIEANLTELNRNKKNIIPVIKNSVKLYEQTARQKGLSLIFHYETDEIICLIDENRFEDILNNLINNAIMYTEKGGVYINACVSVKNDKDYARITVKDTGIGIPNELHKQIFAPFRQVSEGLNRKYEGTGLGLTLTKRYAELMNGHIFLNSKVGEGSEFIVEFPLINVHADEQSAELPKALFVEDEYENFELLKILLKSHMDIDNAVDGYQALEMIQMNNYKIIFMDIGLKGIDGLETAGEIRKTDKYKTVPIIAITAFAMPGDRERILENGCDEYLPKPFKKETLFAILKKYINLN